MASAVALTLVTADLAVANSRCIFTAPQSLMEVKPKLVELIEKAERESSPHAETVSRASDADLGSRTSGVSRPRPIASADFVDSERRTIQPKYGAAVRNPVHHDHGGRRASTTTSGSSVDSIEPSTPWPRNAWG